MLLSILHPRTKCTYMSTTYSTNTQSNRLLILHSLKMKFQSGRLEFEHINYANKSQWLFYLDTSKTILEGLQKK